MIGVLLLAAVLGPADTTRVVDAFDEPARWSAHPADGVQLALRRDQGRQGGALRLDFSFGSGGGYAIARRAVDLDLPVNYAFTFWIRGAAPVNTLEFKLIDASGENVWWYTERDRTFSHGWQKITIRRRQVAFAWGPLGGGTLTHVAAIELVITAGRGGGGGSVWFDDLALTPLSEVVAPSGPPALRASAASAGHPPEAILDADSTTSWRANGPEAALTIDFGRTRELGGVTLAWERGRAPRHYALDASEDGTAWRVLTRRVRGIGSQDALYLPDTETRFLRLRLHAPEGARGFGLATARIEPITRAASRNLFFEGIAQDAPPGRYPRYLRGDRGYWTVVGVDGAVEEALIDEDGAVEAGSGAFRLEPFLTIGGRLVTWNDVQRQSTLLEQRLPIPTVSWRTGTMRLTTTAFPAGTSRASSVVVRYRLHNEGAARLQATLHLAARPFQVNPSWQFLGTPGGVSRIDSVRWDGVRLVINGDRSVRPLVRPARVGATAFASGDIVDYLDRGWVPVATAVRDPFGAASAALSWPLSIAPGDSATIAVEMPLDAAGRGLLAAGRPSAVDSALAAAAAGWRQAVDRATISLPAAGAHLTQSIASTIAYVLINRDGPAIQPGSRSYERSWIRDGSLTSAALLRFGHADAVRDFLRWYAPHQYPNGKIPCCVDRRGADPVPEHDSHGEFIFLTMEYFRHTGDRPMLEAMWPHVVAAVGYMDSLRRLPVEDVLFRGLLPASISHEGYSAKPMHSYWDDFFALRGYKDATAMARLLGHDDAATSFARSEAEFARDLYASLALAMTRHRIDFLPGAADLGDFDATSTTIAVSPGGEMARLPRAALERTFERYWEAASARQDSTTVWEAYTPYELRTVGTMLRLGWKDRALSMLQAFLRDQEPMAWNQWPEIVWHDRRAPKFIGDLPHTWVGSDFLRSAADLFVYEREADSALVVGAGIDGAWLADAGVRVSRLSTWWGPLSYTMTRDAVGTVVQLDRGVRVPPGGLEVHVPGATTGARLLVNSTAVVAGPGGVVTIRTLPARITRDP
jgi:hypothetical protein